MLLHEIPLPVITLRQNQNLKHFKNVEKRKPFYISDEKTYNAFFYVSELQRTVL